MSDERKENRQRMMEYIQLLEGSKLEPTAANIEFLEQNWDLVDKHKSAYCQCNEHTECLIGQFLSGKITTESMQRVKEKVIKPQGEVVEKVGQYSPSQKHFAFPDQIIISSITETLSKLKNNTSDMFTLLKDEDGIEKFTIETMSRIYMNIYPQLEEWQAIMLYFMRTSQEFKQMISEIAEANTETRQEFFDLVKQQKHLQ